MGAAKPIGDRLAALADLDAAAQQIAVGQIVLVRQPIRMNDLNRRRIGVGARNPLDLRQSLAVPDAVTKAQRQQAAPVETLARVTGEIDIFRPKTPLRLNI